MDVPGPFKDPSVFPGHPSLISPPLLCLIFLPNPIGAGSPPRTSPDRPEVTKPGLRSPQSTREISPRRRDLRRTNARRTDIVLSSAPGTTVNTEPGREPRSAQR
ncbi:hypothetical protein AAFF_G00434170 [Aldrovandia affinis]|uniref:Uncharacterized protein n=1 Tax=Aldrovandia affinis TaxID=143900 RepID=A0AAD7S8H1_9TELE|nr:hypothetical protein AAFF_G00434170 [Aldrovandia affinis]